MPPLAAYDCIAFHLPMHTATRMAAPLLAQVHQVHPHIRLACYGLYAPLNADYLRSLGATSIIGGEFEAALTRWVNGGDGLDISHERLAFLPPRRDLLPVLGSYSKLQVAGEARVAGYTEASRGCKHLSAVIARW